MRKTVLTIGLSLVAASSVAANLHRDIPIRNQQEFDALQEKVEAAVNAGAEDITVRLDPGTFFFSHDHLKLYGKDWNKISLTISGSGSILTAAGLDCRDGDPWAGPFVPELLFLGSDRCLEGLGRPVRSPGLVKIEDSARNLCRIRAPKEMNLRDLPDADAYILLSRWYESRTYRVTQIRDGWVYFIADDLERVSPLGYNVNYDFLYGQKMPRFRLFNAGDDPQAVSCSGGKIHLPGTDGVIHVCTATTFLNIHNTRIKSLCLSGLEFRGNADREGRHLIGVYHCRCQLFSVKDCRFSDINSSLFTAEHTDHVEFEDNTFQNCHKHVLSTVDSCREARFLNNSFNGCGCDWGPWACIIACGDGYRISGNRFCNFGYVGILIGGTESRLVDKEPGGIIEHNTLWYEPAFLADTLTHTMMDSGAIYIGICNDIATVRHNYIHDIGGLKDNRGIFCDDGARNFDIYDNVILNIVNSYSIDSRRVPEPEGRRIPQNVGNSIHDNLVNAPIRFEGNEEGDRCVLGINYLLRDADGTYPGLKVKNISRQKPQRKIKSIQGTKWETTVR